MLTLSASTNEMIAIENDVSVAVTAKVSEIVASGQKVRLKNGNQTIKAIVTHRVIESTAKDGHKKILICKKC